MVSTHIPEAAEDPSEDEILSAADKLAMLIDNIQPDGKPFLHTRKPWRSPAAMAPGETDVVLDCHPRKVCARLAECAGKVPRRWRMSLIKQLGLSQFDWQRSSPRR